MNEPVPIVSRVCVLAEGPLWDARRQQLFWTDVPEGKIYGYDPATGRHELHYSGEPVGGYTFNRDGLKVLFRTHNICWLDAGGRIVATQPIRVPGSTRFNDVVAAPDGSVFAGTIGETKTSGGVYHFRTDGTVRRLFTGTGCSNGMGFSPDFSVFYWTCSTRFRIYAFPYRKGEVQVDGERVFYQSPEENGTPDGMAIDRDGNIWSAHWGGWGVTKLDPSGRKIDFLPLPRTLTTSVAFGGPDLDRLYITIAADDKPEEHPDQCLFEWKSPAARGHEEFLSALDPSLGLKLVE